MARSANSGGTQPWVSYGLLAAILLLSGSFHLRSGAAVAKAEAAVAAAVEFYADNPEVELSDRLEALADPAELAAIRESHGTRRDGGVEMPQRLRARDQARFDALVDTAAAARHEASPAWRYGVMGRQDPARNYVAHVFYCDTWLALVASLVFLALSALALESAVGSLPFAVFCVLSATLTVAVHAVLYGDLGIPWSGPGGIIVGLLGLSLGLGVAGGPLPALLVLPLWLGVDDFVLRDGLAGGIASLPLYAQGAGVALGVAFGFAWPARSTTKARAEGESGQQRESLLGRAEALRAEGKAIASLALIEEELKRSAADHTLVEAYWQLAGELRHRGRAALLFAEGIRASLKRGDAPVAVEDWLELVAEVPDVDLEPALLVRLGEALLDEGHPEAATDALWRSLKSRRPMASTLAIRAVNVARDLDPDLAGRAAEFALRDPHLDAARADSLRGVVEAANRARAEQEVAEKKDRAKTGVDTSSTAPAPESTSLFDTSMDQDLALEDDFNASLADRCAGPEEGPSLEESFNADLPDDLFSDLDPHAIAADRLQENVDLPDDLLDLDPNALSARDLQGARGTDASDVTEPEADTAVTDALFTQAAAPSHPPLDETPVVAVTTPLRGLKIVVAVPLALKSGSLEMEVAGRGKSRVHFDRIQAISVGAVSGISAKPVIVVDLVLNWLEADVSRLKLIRMRSDQFNPVPLFDNALSPLDAMQRLLSSMLDGSAAIPLPTENAVRGRPFASHPSLADYHRDVLKAAED